ncbi:hypothetical protein JOB18_037076 [Solea senegalensis]|uniref:Uncharacterized protein n=1 Tax=Solea senegalensis TaxID=28829 RepID=A0AAV6QM27_SOLSE|nr:hypothetical protein JOB18_037076 [Solea senegalensis]
MNEEFIQRTGVSEISDSSSNDDYNMGEITDTDTSLGNLNRIETLQKENDDLRDTINQLQHSEKLIKYNLEQTQSALLQSETDYYDLLPKVRKRENLLKEKLRQIENLTAQVCDLRSQVDKAHEAYIGKDEEMQELNNQSQAEIRTLNEALIFLQKHEDVLNEQKSMLMAELTKVNNVLQELYKDNDDLRAVVQDLQDQVMKDHEIISHQNTEIAANLGIMGEMNEMISDLKRSLTDLKSQQEIEQEGEIMESLQAEILKNHAQEHQQLETQNEIENLKSQVCDLQSQVNEAHQVLIHKVKTLKIELTDLQKQEEVQKERTYMLLTQLTKENNVSQQLCKDVNDLRAAVQDLQDQVMRNQETIMHQSVKIAGNLGITEINEIISDFKKSLTDLKSQQEMKQQEEILGSLQAEILKSHAQEHQQLEAQRQIEKLRAQVIDLQCQGNEAHKALIHKVKTLKTELTDLQKQEQVQKERTCMLLTELTKEKNISQELCKDINDLRAAVQDLQDQVTKDQEIIKHQSIKISANLQIMEGMYEIIYDFKKSLSDLKSQQEMKQEDEILESIQAEILKSHAQEHQQLEAQREMKHLKARLCDLQSQGNEAHRALIHKVKTLKTELIDLQKQEQVQRERTYTLLAQLTKEKNVSQELYKEIKDLRAAVQYLQDQVTKDQDIVTQQSIKIADSQQIMIFSQCSSVCDVKKSLTNLTIDQEIKQEVVESLQSVLMQTFYKDKKTSVQILQDPVIKAPEMIVQQAIEIAEKRQITEEHCKVIVGDFQKPHTDLETKKEEILESIQTEILKNHLQEQQQQRLEAPAKQQQQLEAHADECQQLETPTQAPWWRRYARCLLKGLPAVGILIPSALLSADPSIPYVLLEFLCHFNQIPVPF